MNKRVRRTLPRYVVVERDRHGKVRIYFRRGKGKRTALPNPRDKQAFDEAYLNALASKPARKLSSQSGTLAWLIEKYKASSHFANLAPSTRTMRDNILQRAAKASAAAPYKSIMRKHILEAMERRPPHAANNFRKIIGQVFSWAVSMELLDINPVDSVRPMKTPQSDGHHTWTFAEVELYKEYWPIGTRERLAMDLLLFTGLRRSDIFRLGQQHITDRRIAIKTQKTGAWVYLQIHPILQASIDSTRTGDLAFLCTRKDLPFSSAASFGMWFGKACRAAGVPGRAHGLRKAGATIAADDGATTHQLMAMYGWTKLEMAERYTREADRKRLSDGASERIENAFAPNLTSSSGNDENSSIKSKAIK